MFKLFQKNKQVEDNFSFLATDIHAHFIYGIDDGAPDMESAVDLVNHMQHLGFSRLIGTPHIMAEVHRNSPETITPPLSKLQAHFKTTLPITGAAEYMLDENFMHIVRNDRLMPLFDNVVLVEQSYLQESRYLKQALFEMQTKGYRPMLAHPERYNFYPVESGMWEVLKDLNCFFQLNLLSLTDYYGPMVRKKALYLLKAGLYDYAGTDTHHLRHIQGLDMLRKDKKMMQRLSEYPFKNKEIRFDK